MGRGVIAELEKRPEEFKIVFKVDDRYREKNLVNGEFQHLEQTLSANINPTLVLDFGVPQNVFERAKFYRSNEIPAIMQCIFGPEKCGFIKNMRGITGKARTPLILVPDFSVIKTLIIKNLRAMVGSLDCDVSRICIDVLYNTERYFNQNQWIYWAYAINRELGEYTEVYRLQGNTLTCGFVQYGFMRISPLDKNEERINVQVFSGEKEVIFSCDLQRNLLSSRISGVMKVLQWYCDLEKKGNLPDTSDNVFLDTLSELV